MPTVEQRLQAIEDRTALEDVLTAYCNAVDSLSDMPALLACFTEDAVFDLGGIGLPRFEGHAAIEGFFRQVFTDMTHHAHYATNFAIDRLDGDTARCHAYIIGVGVARDGQDVLVYVRYDLDYARTPWGWKMTRFGEAALMPLPASLTGIHGRD
jgi:ketosteroid isomerase-like protein